MKSSSQPKITTNASGKPLIQRPGRRERKRDATRERIFRTALKLFAKRGFTETTVEDITEAADVGKGTFFNYFPGKEHVLFAFADMQIGRIERGAEGALRGNVPVREMLRQTVQALAEEPGKSAALVRAIVGTAMSNPELRGFMRGKMKHGRAAVTGVLRLGQERGEVRLDIPADVLARAVHQAFFGGLALWALDEEGELAERQERMFELVWLGITTEAANGGKK